jgi:hypothetical protein
MGADMMKQARIWLQYMRSGLLSRIKTCSSSGESCPIGTSIQEQIDLIMDPPARLHISH